MRKLLVELTACASLVMVLATQSCTKKGELNFTEVTNFQNSSTVQLYMAMVMLSTNRDYLHVDGNLVNGAPITTGSVFPASPPGFAVTGGLRAFLVRDTVTATTQVPLSFAENMQVNKSYTIFVYDTINAPKQKTVETPIVIPSDNTARIRFANFVYNPTVIPAVDIFSKRRNANVFTNVQVSQVSDFIPFNADLTDTFYVRLTGTTVNLQNWKNTSPTGWVDIAAILTPRAKRSYTLVFRGGYRSTMTNLTSTGNPANPILRTLSVFTNY